MGDYNFWTGFSPGIRSAGRRLRQAPLMEEDAYNRELNTLSQLDLRDAQRRKHLADAAAQEVETAMAGERPGRMRQSAVAMSGATEPELADFEGFLKSGQMPTRVVEDDALQQSRVEPKYNWNTQQQERLRAAIQSMHNALGGKLSDADSLAKAAGTLQQTGNLQTAVQAAAAGLNPNAYLLKPGTLTNRAVGSTGVTLDELTGRQDIIGGSNPLWERHKAESVSRETENRAQAGNAAASADRTRAAMAGEAAQNVARYLDKDGNIVEVATVVAVDPKTKAKGYQRLQLNPATGRFDMPMQPGLRPAGGQQGDPLVAAAIATAMGGQPGGPRWAGNAGAPAPARAAPTPARTAAGAIGGVDQEAARREANQVAIQMGGKVGSFVPGKGWEVFGADGKLAGYADGKAE